MALAFRSSRSMLRMTSNRFGLSIPNGLITPRIPARYLNIHEYQAHQLLVEHGVPAPKGFMASSAAEARAAADTIGSDCVIKAQVLAGGRGLGQFKNGFRGGVHVCNTPEEVESNAAHMLGQLLVTKQTGAAGKPCNHVFIAERVYARREMYFAIAMDRSMGGPVIVASRKGGTSIEQLAHDDPSSIIKVPVSVFSGACDNDITKVVDFIGFRTDSLKSQASSMMHKLVDLFLKKDATLVEINPLVETNDGRVLCADAKVNFDDNAEFRQPEVWKFRDPSQEDPREVEAAKHNLNYIGLDGNIGCIVNGAGLAMSTLDLIHLHGGSPANFLDVGGGASHAQVKEALKILQNDSHVRSIFVNIFGGIMRCDHIALGIINAASEVHLTVPIVVRLQGTRDKEGLELIEESGLRIISARDIDDGAKKAVKTANIMQLAHDVGMNVRFELPL